MLKKKKTIYKAFVLNLVKICLKNSHIYASFITLVCTFWKRFNHYFRDDNKKKYQILQTNLDKTNRFFVLLKPTPK